MKKDNEKIQTDNEKLKKELIELRISLETNTFNILKQNDYVILQVIVQSRI